MHAKVSTHTLRGTTAGAIRQRIGAEALIRVGAGDLQAVTGLTGRPGLAFDAYLAPTADSPRQPMHVVVEALVDGTHAVAITYDNPTDITQPFTHYAVSGIDGAALSAAFTWADHAAQ